MALFLCTYWTSRLSYLVPSQHNDGRCSTVIYGEKRKSVTFNFDDPIEKEMYQFACSTKFATLVKRYLRGELQRRKSVQNTGSGSITVKMG